MWVARFPRTLFLFIKQGIDGSDRRRHEGNVKKKKRRHEFHCQDVSCLSQENFKNFIKDQNTMQEIHNKFLRCTDYPLHNVCPSKQRSPMCQWCAVCQSLTIIRIDVELKPLKCQSEWEYLQALWKLSHRELFFNLGDYWVSLFFFFFPQEANSSVMALTAAAAHVPFRDGSLLSQRVAGQQGS